jgi:hypothetical protein
MKCSLSGVARFLKGPPEVESMQRNMPTRNPILVWPWRFAFANRLQICVNLSRLLLGFAFVELLTMPLTQHFWTWDRFLQGGQDFELGLFVIVTCVCLVLLCAQHCHQTTGLLLAFFRAWLLPRQRSLFRLCLAPVCILAARPADPLFPKSVGAFLIPLQI